MLIVAVTAILRSELLSKYSRLIGWDGKGREGKEGHDGMYMHTQSCQSLLPSQ